MAYVLTMLQSLVVVPMALLPIINPLSSAPVFVATAGRSQKVVEQLARQVAVNSFYVIVASMVLGTHILALFGLSLPVVRIGGGLLVAFTGWRMLHHTETDEVQAAAAKQAGELSETEIVERSFFPMTFPLTTGPGTIAAAIALGTQILPGLILSSPTSAVQWLAAVAVAVAGSAVTAYVLYLVFKQAGPLLDRLGPVGTLVMMRMIAFLLLCIGIQFIFTGWAEFYTTNILSNAAPS